MLPPTIQSSSTLGKVSSSALVMDPSLELYIYIYIYYNPEQQAIHDKPPKSMLSQLDFGVYGLDWHLLQDFLRFGQIQTISHTPRPQENNQFVS